MNGDPSSFATFSDWLQKRRAELELSQDDVAQKVGVSQAAVSRWCRGQTRPGGRHILGLARALSVPLQHLGNILEATEAPPASPLPGTVDRQIADLQKRVAALERLSDRGVLGK